MDPQTSQLVRPGTLSTIFLALSGLSLMLLLLRLAAESALRSGESNVRAAALGTALLNIAAFALYAAFWRACRPWSGWFLYLVGTTVAPVIVGAIFGVTLDNASAMVVTVGPPSSAPPPSS